MPNHDDMMSRAQRDEMLAHSWSPATAIQGLRHGESTTISDGSRNVTVSYHRRQSYGDNGRMVGGAYTGEYTVQRESGRTTTHEHGPHATTEASARKGANPSAKAYAAEQALGAVRTHFSTAGTFHDRRA